MKKKSILLLSIIPLIASCHGANISKDDAKVILSDLEYYLNNVNVDEYPMESFTSKGESFNGENRIVSKAIYSKSKMFYYAYNIIYPVDETQKVLTREYWIYGWSVENTHNIYYVFRDSGGDYLPMNGRESMEDKYPTLEEFNVAWGEADALIEKDTAIKDTLNAVKTMQELVSYIEGDEYAVKFSFQSADNTSIYYSGNYDSVGMIEEGKEEKIYNYHEIDIFSAKINSYSYEYYGENKDLKRYTKYTYDYGNPEIVYPKIN